MSDKVWVEGGGVVSTLKSVTIEPARKYFSKISSGGVLRLVVIPLALFLVFAPGYLLSLPAATQGHCATQAPFPAGIAACFTNADDPCAASTTWATLPSIGCTFYANAAARTSGATDRAPVCAARAKCESRTRPMVVSRTPWIVHGILFTLVFGITTHVTYFGRL